MPKRKVMFLAKHPVSRFKVFRVVEFDLGSPKTSVSARFKGKYFEKVAFSGVWGFRPDLHILTEASFDPIFHLNCVHDIKVVFKMVNMTLRNKK